jgi:hypothetical protein
MRTPLPSLMDREPAPSKSEQYTREDQKMGGKKGAKRALSVFQMVLVNFTWLF